MDMVSHRSRDADAARRTLSLEPCRHIHNVAVDVRAVWNHIADVDADAETECSVGRQVGIVGGQLLLHLHDTTHCPINAVEYQEEGVTSRVGDPATILV